MRPRQDITEMFSTFALVENDRFSKWLVDIKLSRSMQNCLNSSLELSNQENFWALYWYKYSQYAKYEQNSIAQSNSLARMHLQAYLQESCYHVSVKIFAFGVNNKYVMADYFQMANAEVEIILEHFNPKISSNLKAFAVMAIKSRLRDILRQRKEADLCSNWALLRKSSKKIYLEAIENAGFKPSMVSQYRLAWICFKQLYVQNQPGGTKALPEPTPQLWEAIAKLYNSYRHQLTQATEECTPQEIKNRLIQAAKYLRTYLFPAVKSLNTFKPDSDADASAYLPDPSSDSPITNMIAVEEWFERQNQISQMLDVLSTALKSLDIKSQQVLKLYYQEELTQQQIMQQLEMSQPTVSRKLVKGRESLLKALIQWSIDLNISVNPNQVKDMSIALEEWLKNQMLCSVNS